jgi:hypothetical protein
MLTKAQLLEELPKFLADKNRGISVEMFAELCGLHKSHIYDVFVHKTEPLTEYVQRRVNKAYAQVIGGEIRIMQRGLRRFMEYREEPKPSMVRRSLIAWDGAGFKLDIGVRPRAEDYRRQNLQTQMKGKR